MNHPIRRLEEELRALQADLAAVEADPSSAGPLDQACRIAAELKREIAETQDALTALRHMAALAAAQASTPTIRRVA